jgi:hypothetical protein
MDILKLRPALAARVLTLAAGIDQEAPASLRVLREAPCRARILEHSSPVNDCLACRCQGAGQRRDPALRGGEVVRVEGEGATAA